MVLVAQDSYLAQQAKGLAAGSWTQLSTSGFDSDLLVQGTQHILQYATNMQWDPINHCVRFQGGGHLEIQKFIKYDIQNSRWERSANTGDFGWKRTNRDQRY